MVSAALKLEAVPAPATVAPLPAPRRTEIALRNVGVAYPAGREGVKTVLSKIDLDILAGEFVAILGETGCGKSTLLRLILGQEFPSTGSIEVDSKPVKKIDSRCGYVPQKYSLFPDRTVLGNVMYGPENANSRVLGRIRPSYFRFRKSLEAEARSYLERMGLRPQDMHKYPHQLSGGMQQRVAIAQALLMRPPVLLMDEAFSALDPSTRSSLQEQLHAIWLESRPTIVFVTHNTQEALLLGTRLILLGRHQETKTQRNNVLLDMAISSARLPFAERQHSTEFHELHEYVKQLAYRSSSMHREIDLSPALGTEGCL
ncbi:MAG TPA: ATP-binding cassette domain-containing protein [Terracidiphilus sp.]|nr:ATP-binding cassette domain-containing protein [Terracidiphilus sp.]